MAFVINSDSLIPIDKPFKVSAGPGAGKTHWLSLHIKNVIERSKLLGVSRKVACISYTNVGADSILERISNDSSFVDVCTIHSFLYNNVIKPFLHFEADRWGINPYLIKVVPTESFLTKGFSMLTLKYIRNTWLSPDSFLEGLRNCKWVYEGSAFTKFKPKYPIKAKNIKGKVTKYPVPQNAYDAYVQYRWSKNLISYDDVIYLAIELIRLHPEIYNILIAKYPYFFIDEFQDSTPPIVDLIKELGNRGVIVGVVGDKAQTIYDFIGASVELFDNFTVPNMVQYEILGNRRSTQEIITLLNCIRKDFPQEPIDNKRGEKPYLLVGDKLNAYKISTEICNSKDVQSLAFPNIVANSMKYCVSKERNTSNLIDSDFDINYERGGYIRCFLKATEYAFHGDLREAWYQLDFVNDDRNITMGYLRKLLNNRDKFINGTLFDFFLFVRNNVHYNIPVLRQGVTKEFYLNHSYLDMAVSMKVSDSNTLHKTVHKAKGEEYDNVLLVIDDSSDIEVLINPNLNEATHRVYYVGMSRAKHNLFINVDSLSDNNKTLLSKLPITIINV